LPELLWLSAEDVDLLAVCTCTGYVCPDVGSRLVAHMGFKNNVQRASIVGLGCAGAVPTLQRVTDFVRASPRQKALMLVVKSALPVTTSTELLKRWSATRFVPMEQPRSCYLEQAMRIPSIPPSFDFESFIDSERIEEVGLQHRNGKLRIVLGESNLHWRGQ
jgi:hypothetical protein